MVNTIQIGLHRQTQVESKKRCTGEHYTSGILRQTQKQVQLCTVNRFDFFRSGAWTNTFLVEPLRQTLTVKKHWGILDRYKKKLRS